MELADELGVSTVIVVAVCQSLGIDASWAGAELSEGDAERVRAAGPPPPGAVQVPTRYGPGGAIAPPTAGPASPAGPPTPPGYGAAPIPRTPPGFGPGPAPAAPLAAGYGLGPTGAPAGFGSGGPGAPPAPFGALPAGVVAPGDPAPARIAAIVPPGTSFATPLDAKYASIQGKSAGGRRAPAVATGWTRWWRAVITWLVTWIISRAILYFIGMSIGLASGIPMKGDGLKILFEVILFVAFYAAGTGWATFTALQGAYVATSSWGEISESNGALKGHVGIVLLWAGAGLMAFVWLVDTVGGVITLFRF